MMTYGSHIRTIDDASLAGWNALSATCCGIAILQWGYLRRRTRYRKLSDIVPRLRCSKCGKPPLRVALCTAGANGYAPIPPELVLPLPFMASSIPLPEGD